MSDDERITTYIGRLRRGRPRKPRVAEEYIVRCVKGHEDVIPTGDLEEVLSFPACNVENCGHEIVGVEPEWFELECTICGADHLLDWEQARALYVLGCDQCPGPSGVGGDVQAVGSANYDRSVRDDWFDMPAEGFNREGRIDYWEGLIHFCEKDAFLSILSDGVIKASRTGYFKAPAVCLTETPLPHTDEIRDRFGPFGFAFLKSDILAVGGNPCLEMSEPLLKEVKAQGALPGSLKPFVNLVRPAEKPGRSFYFLHEREWRVPSDILLKKTVPKIVLPADKKLRLDVLSDDDVLAAVSRFGRLRSFRIR